jgi:crotonobetainyl-CoA:carnitine CoA-transferase CaiB-like acyl-CoA transferase
LGRRTIGDPRVASDPPVTAKPGSFDGIRILELTTGIPGRVAGMLLADLGADVVRVVTPRELDSARHPGSLCWDRRKRRIALDDASPSAAAALELLTERADVVISDATPDDLVRRDLQPEKLRTRRPTLVFGWLPATAPKGEWKELPSDPLLLEAVGGFAAHHPAVSDVPVASVVPTLSYLHGALGASAVAAALVSREFGGGGSCVTVSGLHASAAVLGAMMIEGLDIPGIFSPGKSRTGAPHYRMYRGMDGLWLYLAALTPDFFFRALAVLDRMDVMARDDVGGEFANLLIPEIGTAVGTELEATFATRRRDDWLELLAKEGVPAAPVSTREAWLSGDTVAALGGRIEVPHGELGTVVLPGIPVTISPNPGAVSPVPGAQDAGAVEAIWPIQEASGHSEASSTLSDAPPREARQARLEPLPLSGLRVVDLCTFLAGPFASSLLADYGAEVIKVETLSGDPYRVYSTSFDAVNQRKRTMALDLRQQAGRDVLLGLIADCDVLIDNLRPASLDRLGLTQKALREANPRTVRCTVSAFGDTGPAAGLPGFDPVIQALSGLATAQGGAGDPVATTAPTHDIATGAVAALGVLAALFTQRRGGTTPRVTASLAASSLLLQCAEFTEYAGRPPAVTGGVDFPGSSPVHRFYRAADGWLALGGREEQLAQIRAALGLAVMADTGRKFEDEATSIISTEGVGHWVKELAARGVASCRVLDREDELADGFLEANNFSHVIRDPELGRLRVVRGYSTWPERLEPPPAAGMRIGEHSRLVLTELLGRSRAEELIRAGVAVAAMPAAKGDPA